MGTQPGLPGAGSLQVAVVIPAYNAAATIGAAIASLQAQTHPWWEAIVVDDGSTDATAALVADLAAAEPRVQLLQRKHEGMCASRNAGVVATSFDWLLFLDADDWVAPQQIERLAAAVVADGTLDIAHCGWFRVTPDGATGPAAYGPDDNDLFDAFTTHCALATPGVCLVRRSCFEEVGGFDKDFPTCGDWDLWLRLARAGARFVAVHEPLTFYRLSSSSSSISGDNSARLLAGALRVITLAHGPDPRVRHPQPAYAEGAPAQHLAPRRLGIICWCAGLAIGRGADARPLLGAVADDRASELDPQAIAAMLFQAIPLASAHHPEAWPDLWPEVEPGLVAFLQALEEHAGAPELERRTREALEQLVAFQVRDHRTQCIGQFYLTAIELTRPMVALAVPREATRIRCALTLEGEQLGTVDLPSEGRAVTARALLAAVEDHVLWTMLGRFFVRTLYPTLEVERSPEGVSLRRAGLLLAERLPPEVAEAPHLAHDQVGWTLLLQELWGRPDWPNSSFYHPTPQRVFTTPLRLTGRSLTLELGVEPPTVVTPARMLEVTLTASGLPVCVASVPVVQGWVSAAELIRAITAASGFALGRAAVQRGLIGKALDAPPTTLRKRLAAAGDGSQARGLGLLSVPPHTRFITTAGFGDPDAEC